MLSRDQVLHVARLARLELTEGEVERFGSELSNVLDHIEKIGELGPLTDVEPTSHVVAVENALREDEPRPSLPVDRALESAPDPAEGGFRVPSPERSGGEAAGRDRTSE
jgi:aspartyl-tRNA(Asn)/glutamyl-tRNA(Gln) amidotransferase subunit C